jgi:putative transposase
MPDTYIVTSITHERRRLFQVDRNAELFIETLQHCLREGHYKLNAFIVMPDHVHFLVTVEEATIEKVVGLIKGGFSHRLGSRLPVWQKGYTDRRCRDAEEFIVRKDCILQTPVRAGLVERREDYRFSSAYRGGDNLSG